MEAHNLRTHEDIASQLLTTSAPAATPASTMPRGGHPTPSSPTTATTVEGSQAGDARAVGWRAASRPCSQSQLGSRSRPSVGRRHFIRPRSTSHRHAGLPDIGSLRGAQPEVCKQLMHLSPSSRTRCAAAREARGQSNYPHDRGSRHRAQGGVHPGDTQVTQDKRSHSSPGASERP